MVVPIIVFNSPDTTTYERRVCGNGQHTGEGACEDNASVEETYAPVAVSVPLI